jgi:hypothetical protein
VPVGQKIVLRFLHANEQKTVDSLQRKALCSVMSITQFSHYGPPGKALWVPNRKPQRSNR